MELISVIVPIYCVEKYLDECIESLVSQTYRNIEIILVDDGSPDASGEICDTWRRQDNRIRVIHANNGGLSSARNRGIEIAEGSYIMFVDSDDFIDARTIEKLYYALNKSGADISVCGIQYVDEEGNIVNGGSMLESDCLVNVEEYWKMYYDIHHGYSVVAWNKLYNIDMFKELRYPIGKIHEDEYVLHDILWMCDRIICLSERLIFYRQRNGSITNSGFNIKRLHYVDAMLKRSEFFYDKGYVLFLADSLLRTFPILLEFEIQEQVSPEEYQRKYDLILESLRSKFKRSFVSLLRYPRKCLALYLFLYNRKLYKLVKGV